MLLEVYNSCIRYDCYRKGRLASFEDSWLLEGSGTVRVGSLVEIWLVLAGQAVPAVGVSLADGEEVEFGESTDFHREAPMAETL